MTCTSLTPAMCQVWCAVNGFVLSGIRNGNRCGCAASWYDMVAQPDSACSSTCIGDGTSQCGGGMTYSVYNSTMPAAMTISPNAARSFDFGAVEHRAIEERTVSYTGRPRHQRSRSSRL